MADISEQYKSRADVLKKVCEIVAEQMKIERGEIKETTRYTNDLNADSLDRNELIIGLEEAFDILIPDEDAEKVQEIGPTADYLWKRLKPNNPD